VTLLLDTNVVSELRKLRTNKADPKFAAWAATLNPADLFISVITVHELEIGVCLSERRDPPKGALFRRWLETQVLPTFEQRILAIDTVTARRAAKLHIPDPQPINDALIAATALVHNLTLATRNVADFKSAGLNVLNPWA
jgi:predicted nucleic acid-binding protein